VSLPTPPAVETFEVEVLGQTVNVRPLTRTEALSLTGEGPLDVAEAESKIIAYATNTPLEDVRAWLAAVPAGAVQPLVERITEVSGLVVSGPFRS
jgi:hypothetical protein